MRRLPQAIRFLTVLPTPWGNVQSGEELARTAPTFPLVGLLVGALLGLLAYGVGLAFPPQIAAILMTAALIGISGALHLDGLADCADGFFSSRPRERILEIMKDSHIGTMGAVVILILILLKVTSLAHLPAENIPKLVFFAVFAGRCSLLLCMNLLPPATPGAGLGSLFCSRCSLLAILWSLLALFGVGWYLLAIPGLMLAGSTVLVTLLFSGYAYWKIRGATGDVLGATCELVEATVLVIPFTFPLFQ